MLRLQQLLQLWAVWLVAPAFGREASSIVASGNPHIPAECPTSSEGSSCECPAQRLLELTAENLVPHLPVQADSFLRLEPRKANGLQVNLYNFKQPARLSELELPFRILPLRRVDLTDLQVIEVPQKQALDSWFPGYAWSILVCGRCQGLHLGWKFTPAARGASNTVQEPFYALIVEAVEAAEDEALTTADGHLLARLRAVGQPLAAIGLAASALQSLGGAA
eukprot:TRINITY_DN114173_c0_g1_i1.p1 TRINITY_DN114173_c0_g1~~TRINITY_DN114173_c0_g1_i1.p1  ORF type:complete len:250 (+),score=62.04 TRINITY_DN114173_c0_g1_i1:87-752(+)